MTQNPEVRVGVGCYIFNDQGQFLIMQRCGSHGSGTWSPPGGHQEWSETPEETAAREVLEETGLVLDPADMVPLGYTNDFFELEQKHYITLLMGCRLPAGATPVNAEPHKCSDMAWWDGKPDGRRLFLSMANFLNQHPDPYGWYKTLLQAEKQAA